MPAESPRQARRIWPDRWSLGSKVSSGRLTLLAITTFTLAGLLVGFGLWLALLFAVYRWGPFEDGFSFPGQRRDRDLEGSAESAGEEGLERDSSRSASRRDRAP